MPTHWPRFPAPSGSTPDRAIRARDLHPLPSSLALGSAAGEPASRAWHQVAELPELAAHITEHQGRTRACSLAVAVSS